MAKKMAFFCWENTHALMKLGISAQEGITKIERGKPNVN